MAAALSNMALGELDETRGDAIVKAADEVIDGRLIDISRWSSGRPVRAPSPT